MDWNKVDENGEEWAPFSDEEPVSQEGHDQPLSDELMGELMDYDWSTFLDENPIGAASASDSVLDAAFLFSPPSADHTVASSPWNPLPSSLAPQIRRTPPFSPLAQTLLPVVEKDRQDPDQYMEYLIRREEMAEKQERRVAAPLHASPLQTPAADAAMPIKRRRDFLSFCLFIFLSFCLLG